jgi:hypothetical protein
VQPRWRENPNIVRQLDWHRELEQMSQFQQNEDDEEAEEGTEGVEPQEAATEEIARQGSKRKKKT